MGSAPFGNVPDRWQLACPEGHRNLIHRHQIGIYVCRSCRRIDGYDAYRYETVQDLKTGQEVPG